MIEDSVGLSANRSDELRARDRLRAGIFTGAIVAVLIGLYAPVFRVWLEDLWSDPNYSHVYIVPIISGLVIWQRRRRLAALPSQGSWAGLPLLVGGIGALIVGDIGAETFLMRTSLIVVIAGLILFHLGPGMLRALVFPLGFCLFLVPMPAVVFYAMTARLQNIAAETGAWGLELVGIPVLLDGNVIQLSRVTLGVTEACSGIRSLITLVALGVAWAHLMLPKFWMQVVLVISVLPITIVSNAGRIVMTGLVGRWFGVEYAEGFFHFFSGWLVFVLAIGCLLAVHGLLRAVSPRRDWEASMSPTARASVSLAILLGALLVLQLRSTGEAVPIRKPLDSFPATLREWQGRRGTIFSSEILDKLRLKDYVMRDYSDGAGRALNLYIGYWDTQKKGAAIHSPKNCLPGAGWEPVEASLLPIVLPAPYSPITVNRYLIQKDRDQLLVFYWYQSQGQVVAGEVPARIAMVKSALLHNRTDGAIVRLMSPTYGNVRETSDRLVAFVQAMYPILGNYLPD